MWGKGVKDKWGDTVEFVGLCDPNPKRAEVVRQIIGVDCPVFTDFDAMVKAARPELVAITTVDAYHAEYIVRALDLGIDVITEKPMTIDEKQTQAVVDAEKRNKRKIIVGHNMRFAPAHVRIKELMLSKPVGTIHSVDFHWYLDTSHGTDYFRRWHGIKAKSGSLWVHKATHHFDYVNWLLDAEPVQVQAYGGIKRYGTAGPFRSTNCRPCTHKAECPFYWDMTKSASAMRLYGGEVEKADGYLRDACVFRPEITTYDTMTATVKYSTDVIMSYSLNAYMPIEGYSLCFNGDGGRVEIRSYGGQPFEVAERDGGLGHQGLRHAHEGRRPDRRGRTWRRRRCAAEPDLPASAGGRPPAHSRFPRRRHVGPHGHCRAPQLRRESAHHHLRPGHLLMSITRRSFVSSAAAGVAGGLVAGTSADAATPYQQTAASRQRIVGANDRDPHRIDRRRRHGPLAPGQLPAARRRADRHRVRRVGREPAARAADDREAGRRRGDDGSRLPPRRSSAPTSTP